MPRMRRSRRRKSPRPPFENRWGAGADGWRWHCELERLGVAYVSARLAQQEALDLGTHVEPLTPPPGFIHDWLAYHERRDRSALQGWRLVALLAVAAVILVAAIAAIPVVRTWL